MAIWKSVVGKSAGPATSTFSKWYFYFLIIIFLVTVSNTLLQCYETRGFEPATQFVIDKMLNPTITMGEQANIIANEGFWTTMNDVWYLDIWDNILRYATIIFNILVIILYVRIFSWIFMKVILGDDSKTFPSYVAGFLTFIGFQMIVAASMKDVDIFDPLRSFYYVFKALLQIKAPDWVSNMPIG